MKFTRDNEFISQEIRKILSQGRFPSWTEANESIYQSLSSGINKTLEYDLETLCSEWRYSFAVRDCTPKLTVPQVEFLDSLQKKVVSQVLRMPYDISLPNIPIEELSKWGCTTATINDLLLLVPDYKAIYREARRTSVATRYNQMRLFYDDGPFLNRD